MVELTKRCQGTVVQPGFVDKKWQRLDSCFFSPEVFFGEINGESKKTWFRKQRVDRFRVSFKVMMI